MSEEREVIGVTVCPICGAPEQELKINKNGKLYMMCDHGCNPRYSGAMSRQYIQRLRAGETVRTFQNQIIRPTKGAKENEETRANYTTTGASSAGNNAGAVAGTAGNATFGRADTRPAGISRPDGRRILSKLWSDEPDE